MLQVAKIARLKWLEVGRSFGFTVEELDEYKEKEPLFLQHRLLHVLLAWKKKVHPTVEAFVSACKVAGIGGLLKRGLQVGKKESLHTIYGNRHVTLKLDQFC